MAYTVTKLDTWTGEIDDRTGALATKLEPLAKAEVNLEMVIARRQPQQPGKGIVFLGPVSGAKAEKAAAAAGLSKATNMAALRVEGPDKPGECQRLARKLADAGINLRGLSATTLGSKWVCYLAFDNSGDADKAAGLIQAPEPKKK